MWFPNGHLNYNVIVTLCLVLLNGVLIWAWPEWNDGHTCKSDISVITIFTVWRYIWQANYYLSPVSMRYRALHNPSVAVFMVVNYRIYLHRKHTCHPRLSFIYRLATCQDDSKIQNDIFFHKVIKLEVRSQKGFIFESCSRTAHNGSVLGWLCYYAIDCRYWLEHKGL